ncbi:MAG: 3-isopropylmalate dehydratase large subunit [Candidatus Woesearchaeota archaeon]
MGYTAIEKIMMEAGQTDNIRPGMKIRVTPSYYLSHDNTGEIIDKLREVELLARERARNKNIKVAPNNPNKIVIAFDHTVGSENPLHKLYHDRTREYVKDYPEINFYDDTAGVSHQVFMEEGYAQPGSLVIGADSHTTMHGAANCAGIPINRTEMAGLWIRDYIMLKVPETIKIVLDGNLSKGVYSKDIMLHILSSLGSSGANYKAIEYQGNGINGLSMSERMTLTNMTVEMDAKTAIMPYDDTLRDYIEQTTKGNLGRPIIPDKDANYYDTIMVNLESLEAMVSYPHSPEKAVPVKDTNNIRITHAYIGSCTNGRYEDLEIAARIVEGRRIDPKVHMMVYPASKKIDIMARKNGVYHTLTEAGAKWMIPACGPCFGAVGSILEEGDVCISSSNRNYKGRMGSPKSLVYLASPATVMASAIAGRIISEEEL